MTRAAQAQQSSTGSTFRPTKNAGEASSREVVQEIPQIESLQDAQKVTMGNTEVDDNLDSVDDVESTEKMDLDIANENRVTELSNKEETDSV